LSARATVSTLNPARRILVWVLLAACDSSSGGRSTSKPLSTPDLSVVRHPLPELPAVDVTQLAGACGLDELLVRDLGGLGLVIAECGAPASGSPCPERGPQGDLGAVGCACPSPRRFVVASEGGAMASITTRAELRRLVVPIESEAEALSYAVAVTGFFVVREGPSRPVDLATERLDTTFVRREGDGYRVHVFTAKTCGCERDFLASTDYLVTRDGEVRALESELVYTVPGEPSCVD
jgi:hypothetical protein